MYILYFPNQMFHLSKMNGHLGVQAKCVGWFMVFYATLNNISVKLFCKLQKGALDSQPQEIKFTMVILSDFCHH